MSDTDTTSPITQSDLDELYQAARLFSFPAFCKQATLLKIHAFLTALLAQPVPSFDVVNSWEAPPVPGDPGAVLALVNQWLADPEPDPELPPIEPLQIGRPTPHREPSTPDWRREYDPPTVEDCYMDCDQ